MEYINLRTLDNGGVTLEKNFLIEWIIFFDEIKGNEITFNESIISKNECNNNNFKITLIKNGDCIYFFDSSKKIFVYVTEEYIPYCVDFKFTHFNIETKNVENYRFTFPLKQIEGDLYIDGICRVKISNNKKEMLYCSYYHRNKIIKDDECFFDEELDIYYQNSYYFPNIL